MSLKVKIIVIVALVLIAAGVVYFVLRRKTATSAALTPAGPPPPDYKDEVTGVTKPWYTNPTGGLQIPAHDVGGGKISFTLNGQKYTGYPEPCAPTTGGLQAHSDQNVYGVPCLKTGFTVGPADGK